MSDDTAEAKSERETKRSALGRFVRPRDSKATKAVKATLKERILEAAPLVRDEEIELILNGMSARKMLVLDLMSNPMRRLTIKEAAQFTGIKPETLDGWLNNKEFVYLKQILERWHIDRELAPVFFDALLEILTRREGGKLIRDSALVKALDLAAGKIGFQAPKQLDIKTRDETRENERKFLEFLAHTDGNAREAMKKMVAERRRAALEISTEVVEEIEEENVEGA